MRINKVEILVEFSPDEVVEGGEDIQEQRFLFIRPNKIQRLIKDPYILSEVLKEIQEK